MNPNNEHPNLFSNLQQAHTDQPGRLTDRIPSIGALRLINGLELAVRWSVGGISRRRQWRTTFRKLQALNDHYLKDIGLDRFEIVSSVEETIKMNTHLS